MSHAAARTLPKKGTPAADVLKRVEAFRATDPTFERGQMTAYCMLGSREVQSLVKDAYGVYFFQNALVRRYMPGLQQMEADVREIAANILSGGTPGVRVNFTSGGSESLFCGLHAAREWAKTKYPNVARPEVIAPYSAHATISKACHFLGLELTRVPVGKDYRADARAMEAAIGPNTIALIASAPSWPYGKVDPIAEIAAVALRRNLWVHVDACVTLRRAIGRVQPICRKESSARGRRARLPLRGRCSTIWVRRVTSTMPGEPCKPSSVCSMA